MFKIHKIASNENVIILLVRGAIWLVVGFLDVMWITVYGFGGASYSNIVLEILLVYVAPGIIFGLLFWAILAKRGGLKFAGLSWDISFLALITIGFRINELYLPSISSVPSILWNVVIILGALVLFYYSRKFLSRIRNVFGVHWILFLIYIGLTAHVIFPQAWGDESWNPASPNLVLVTLDTVRADHLGAYGYERDTSPVFDEFASSFRLFTNIRTPIPLTAPSHASLFSGMMPNQHGVFTNISDYPDGDEFPTIADELAAHGYMTVGFPAAVHMGREFNFNRGFTVYNESTVLTRFPGGQSSYQLAPVAILSRLGLIKATHLVRDSHQVNQAFIKWVWNYKLDHICDNHPRPFFAWLHYFDAHSPYQPPEEYWRQFDPSYNGPVTGSQEECDDINAQLQNYFDDTSLPDGYTRSDIDNLVARYDGEILRIDESLGELFNELKRLGLWEDTVIILVSDHGEGMYDDGYFGHNFTLKEYEIRLACAVKGPDIISPENEPLSIIDVTDYMRYIGAVSDASQCRLTMPSDSEEPDENPYTSMVFLKSHCWIDPPYKLIRTYEGEGRGISYSLFDYIADPREINDLFAAGEDRSETMKNSLQEWLENNHADFPELLSNERTREDIDPATLEMLRSLGYIY